MKPSSVVVFLLACWPALTLCQEDVTEVTTLFPEGDSTDVALLNTVMVSTTATSTTAEPSTPEPTTASTTTTTTTTTTTSTTTAKATTTTTTPTVTSTIIPELSVIEKELIPHLLNVSENVVDEKRDKEAELLAWEAPDEIRANYPYYLSGFDAENRPIWVAELGKWNLRKIIEAGGDNFKAFDKYVQQSRVRITKSRAIKSTPEHIINEAVFLIDLDQLNLAQIASVPTVSYILSLARQYRKLLTEHTGVAVVVNANFVAESLVNIVRPVLGAILEKTEIYGTNRARWLPHVLRHFPKDQIPEWYGGFKGFTPIQVYG